MGGEPRWPVEREAELWRLYQEGLSLGDIARRLHITKSAVIGKCHRLHFPPRPSPIIRDEDDPRRRMPSPLRVVGKVTLPRLPSLGP